VPTATAAGGDGERGDENRRTAQPAPTHHPSSLAGIPCHRCW
jgi:hypothetical protein